jgi:hypothetical protein
MIGPTLAVALAFALAAPPDGDPAATSPAEPAATPPLAAAPPSPPPAAPARAVPWLPGERMEYVIDYLGITMGKAALSVGATVDGAAPLQLSSRSAGLLSVITFRQTLVSDLDLATFLPRSSILDALEPGDYKHTDTARFDRATDKATVREKGRFDNTYEIEVPPGTIDFVALVFTLRTLPLPDGATHTFQVLAGRKVSPVLTSVVKRESLRTDAGRFPCVKVRVPTGFDGKFSEKNPTYVWFSDDARRLVVRISTDFAIGRADADLSRYQPGQAEAAAVVPAPAPAPPPAP